MRYIPYEKMVVDWIDASLLNDEGFMLKLLRFSREVDVTPKDKGWIRDAAVQNKKRKEWR